MLAQSGRLTVLQAKFGAWLAWSQPFIHELVRGVGRSVDNVVVCNRTENLDRFAVPRLVRLPVRYVTEPRLALLAAAHLRRTYRPDAIHAHFGWSGLRMLLQQQAGMGGVIAERFFRLQQEAAAGEVAATDARRGKGKGNERRLVAGLRLALHHGFLPCRRL